MPKSERPGICLECGHWKGNCWMSICGDCRKAYGRKMRKQRRGKKIKQ